jgi:hypothetical protein
VEELTKIVLTAGTTIVGGVLIFALSQLTQRLVLDPIAEQRKVIADIDVALTYRGWTYASPGDPDRRDPDRDAAADEFRRLASRLIATSNAILWWRPALRLGAIAPEAAREASRRLIGICNQIYHPPGRPIAEWGSHNSKSAKEIRRLLALSVDASG